MPQTVDGFEVVTNLPLSLGIGVDTSGSMEESIVEAQKAAVEFLKDVMTKRDRSFLVTFDNEPQLVSRFTTDRERLAQALAGLRARARPRSGTPSCTGCTSTRARGGGRRTSS